MPRCPRRTFGPPPTPTSVRFVFPVLAAALLLVGTAFHAPPPAPGGSAPADTLRLSVGSGEPLVTLLPGDEDITFRPLRAPALSWLVGRSFYWNILPAERGREFVLVERRRREEPLDTLVIVVDVEPQ